MRVQRHKANRKTLNFFRLLFKVRAPFRVLLDGNFLAAAARYKVEWRRLLPKLLHAEPALVHLHVTECVLAELDALGERVAGAAAEARALPLLKCRAGAKHGAPHGADCAPAACLAALVGAPAGANAGHWVVVTQDAALRGALRRVPGVPLALISTNVLVLEPPSDASRAASRAAEAPKSALRPDEAKAVRAAEAALRARDSGGVGGGAATAVGAPARAAPAAAAGAGAGAGAGGGGAAAAAAPKRKKRRGPSEPNPLSTKKRARVAAPTAAGGGERAPTRRKVGGGGGGAAAGDGAGDADD